jgi:hypothetical protein
MKEGHTVVKVSDQENSSSEITNLLANSLVTLYEKWAMNSLKDNSRSSPYTTNETVKRMLSFL